ncbi:MAG: hypothetical protein SFX73_29460 [Kofleriaceae bacterium]|nr:hypothetical protein [Kofleriaceae bacterium]
MRSRSTIAASCAASCAAGSATGSAATTAAPTTPSTAKAEGAKQGSTSGEGNWQCTASSSVRVCGFAGACNYQLVFGNGWGKDHFFASKQAKSSCEASARAKGATAVCVVHCSVR